MGVGLTRPKARVAGIDAAGVAPKPAGLTFEQAAAVPAAATTALRGIPDVGEVKAGQRMLVNGAGGGAGTYDVQIAVALAHTPAFRSCESFRIEHARGGIRGTLRFYAYGSGLVIPGSVRAWSMRHVMTETWHNYFPDPGSAPDPDPAWLAGGSAVAMIKTDRAISREHPDAIEGASSYEGPALVLYGASDIFADGTQIVRSRFPHAIQVTLQDSGHVHWLQNPSGYADALREFYDHVPGSP
jgi:pimeloyl-ACP methyl ester carboxylesterase